MANKDKVKNETAEPLDINAMKQAIRQQRQQDRERCILEIERICKEMGFVLGAEPYIENGLTRARAVIYDTQEQ